jgi:putative endonuclease
MSFYVGSTRNLKRRLAQHQAGEGANHTRKRLPVRLVYFEEYPRVQKAFYREKQVQGWSRKKKEALINGKPEELRRLAECMNDSHCKNHKALVSTTLVSTTLNQRDGVRELGAG